MLIRHLPADSATVGAVRAADPPKPEPSAHADMVRFFGGSVRYTPKETADEQ